MRRAVIYRATGRNSFAVQIQHLPGIKQIFCSQFHIEDRESFESAVKKLHPGPREGKQAVPVSLLSEDAIPISVQLGPVCLRDRAFVSCSIVHPPLDEDQPRLCDSGGESPIASAKRGCEMCSEGRDAKIRNTSDGTNLYANG